MYPDQTTTGNFHNTGVLNYDTKVCEMPTPAPIPKDEMRPINIQPLSKGFVVQVGCQSLAIETKEKLVEKLTAYIMDPAGSETLYNSNEFL